MPTDQSDSDLDRVQDQIDDVRDRAADNPGFDLVDEDDVPAYFDDGNLTEEPVTKEQAAELDDPDDHQGHAPG